MRLSVPEKAEKNSKIGKKIALKVGVLFCDFLAFDSILSEAIRQSGLPLKYHSLKIWILSGKTNVSFPVGFGNRKIMKIQCQ